MQDTWNLIGHALATEATCSAKAVQRPRAEVLREAGMTLLAASSLKTALDIDWDDPAAKGAALARLLAEADRLEQWVATHAHGDQITPALHAGGTAMRVNAWTSHSGVAIRNRRSRRTWPGTA